MQMTRVLGFFRRSECVERGNAKQVPYQVQDQFDGHVIRRRARRPGLREGLCKEGCEDGKQSTSADGRITIPLSPPGHSAIVIKGIMMTRVLDE